LDRNHRELPRENAAWQSRNQKDFTEGNEGNEDKEILPKMTNSPTLRCNERQDGSFMRNFSFFWSESVRNGQNRSEISQQFRPPNRLGKMTPVEQPRESTRGIRRRQGSGGTRRRDQPAFDETPWALRDGMREIITATGCN
jgi:hypothetical protein